jgi:hypothetical protein
VFEPGLEDPMNSLWRLAVPTSLALLAACGTGLYDASGLPSGPGGGGQVCEATLVSCPDPSAPSAPVCTTEDVRHCGASCLDCTAGGPPPAGAVIACVGAGTPSHGQCGFSCTDGLLKCGTPEVPACCGATALAAGPAYTCALLTDGAVRCWGENASGQIGSGDTAPRPKPSLVALPTAAIAIGAGAGHACAVLAGGAVRCWGENASGQVTGAASSAPVLAPAATPVTSGAVAVAGGAGHTCALLGSGAVRCWGAPARTGGGQPIASGATGIAAGRDHTCAVVSGAVRCWGANALGQLGTAAPADTATTPIASGIMLVAAGANQTCASTGSSNGTNLDDAVRCWGDSVGAGYLFDDPQRTPAIPRRDATRSTIDKPAELVAAGAHHVCIRNRNEAVECFGANDQNQLGASVLPGETALVPLPAVALPVARALATGDAHGCAALADGRIRCWGSNAAGQLGDGTTTSPPLSVLVVPSGE